MAHPGPGTDRVRPLCPSSSNRFHRPDMVSCPLFPSCREWERGEGDEEGEGVVRGSCHTLGPRATSWTGAYIERRGEGDYVWLVVCCFVVFC
jgi:hypothetical protein